MRVFLHNASKRYILEMALRFHEVLNQPSPTIFV